MPFKSESQRRFFYAANKRGDISDTDLSQWESETPKGRKLPERIGKKATIEKTAHPFWEAFFKTAEAGDGASGFWGVGKAHSKNPVGQLEYDQYEGTQQSHGRADGEDTRTEKKMRDQERGPHTYNYREVGDVVHNDQVPHILQ